MIERFLNCHTRADSQTIRENVVLALTSLLSTRAHPNFSEEVEGASGFWRSLLANIVV